MFHIAVGLLGDNATPTCTERTRSMRIWESRFSCDPFVYHSSSSSNQDKESREIITDVCEVKIFRDYAGLLEGVPFDILPAHRGCRLLVLGIPGSVSVDSLIGDRLNDIKYYSVLRRSLSVCESGDFDRSLLLVFQDQVCADLFYRDWHLQFFDSSVSSGPLCYLLFIDKVMISSATCSEFINLLPLGSQQIPSCSFCIERIDVTVSGVITSRRGWLTDRSISNSCVACRNLKHPLSCLLCGGRAPSLWLCLLCGHVGCGRYAKGDAQSHFQESHHVVALEISTGRIWDYSSDQFVHRRLATSSGIMDLPERQSTLLPVHPQVSFEEDISELDKTMHDQIEYERSKYEEACTQLRILGSSRVQQETTLMEQDRAQERALRAELATAKSQLERKTVEISQKSREIQILEKCQNRARSTNNQIRQTITRMSTEEVHTEVADPELDRLETLATKLRLQVAQQFS